MTTDQAAKLLGVTRRSVQMYVASGKLRYRRYGLRVVVIKLDDLRKFAIENNRVFDESLAEQLGQN